MKKNVWLAIGLAVGAVVVYYAAYLNQRKVREVPELPFGTYTLRHDAIGANSRDNLALINNCFQQHDTDCEMAMRSDGRAFPVKAGTSIMGSEIEHGVFSGEVRSGSLAGTKVYLIAEAFK